MRGDDITNELNIPVGPYVGICRECHNPYDDHDLKYWPKHITCPLSGTDAVGGYRIEEKDGSLRPRTVFNPDMWQYTTEVETPNNDDTATFNGQPNPNPTTDTP